MKRYLFHPAVIKILKLIPVSLGLIIVLAALSILYGFIAHTVFTLRYVFDVNFFAGAILIAIGIILMFLPSAFLTAGRTWLERSAFLERSYDSREVRQKKARMILWFGIVTLVLTGLIQILLSVII